MHSIYDETATADETLTFAAAFQIECHSGQILLAPSSPLNPFTEWIPLVSLYEEATPLPPTPEEIDTLLGELAPRPIDRDEFAVQAVILRCTARQYYAA